MDPHQEILHEAIHDETPPRKHRLLILAISIIVILGMILAFSGGGRLLSFILGRTVSSTVQDMTLVTDQGHIIILGEVYLELKEKYEKEQAHEWAACLIGTRDEQIVINQVYFPKIYDKSVFSVRSERCPSTTIITLHSHPPEHCIFSSQDMIAYEQFLQINPDALTAIMCGEDRFSVYSN